VQARAWRKEKWEKDEVEEKCEQEAKHMEWLREEEEK
jgi:hypothetical protein